MYQSFFKRVIDLTLSLMALIIFSPVLISLSILIRIKLGKPVLFNARRPGYRENIFTLYKFRTMSDERDDSGELLPDHIRLTKLGRMLRTTSLDELPELFNILKGDMSIVGPRPLAEDYLPHYTKEERKRHHVKPGLTGWAQVNGRNSLNWKEKFAYDLEYVDNIGFTFDMKIIFKTIIQVFKQTNIGERGTGRMIDFDEYRKQSQTNIFNNE